MEVLIYQVVIAILILLAGSFGKKTRNIVTIVICLFTIIQVFTLKLALLQFFTIFVAFMYSKNQEEKKIIEKKEEFNYYVIEKESENESSSSTFFKIFIVVISIISTVYIFNKRNELKRVKNEQVNAKQQTVVDEKNQKYVELEKSTEIEKVQPQSNLNEENVFSNDKDFLQHKIDNGSIIEYCNLRNLSYDNEYTLILVKKNDRDLERIFIRIVNKLSNEIQIKHCSSDYFNPYFIDCDDVKSYITGYKVNEEIEDGNHGDFIVGDFNFDNREDCAIKVDNMSNAGARYKYFLQGKNGDYYIDDFLTNELGFFPDEFNFKNKTISISRHADACGFNETVYKYNGGSKKWNLLKSEYVRVCD